MEADGLRALPARRIAGFIADAAERWSDADFAPRVRTTQAIRARLGYSEPVVDYALDRLFGALRRPALEAAIAAELGSPDALDGVRERTGVPPAWARGVERVTVVSSDTTIGVALPPALFALCAKCTVTVKDRNDALVSEFFATLAQEHPAFAQAARARAWSGGDDPAEADAFGAADVVVAFGGDDALRAVRARCGPETRFIAFGHRASIGRLDARETAALDRPLAERIARDALLYDGEGCLSLHALFVQAHGDALARAGTILAAGFERAAIEFPAGATDAARAAAAAAYRNLTEFRAAGGRGLLLRPGGATLALDVPADQPPALLPRTLPVYAVQDDAAIERYVRAHHLPVQALGVVEAGEAALALAARIGAVRVAPLGSLQDPPLGGHHGGAPRIADFVRWIDAR